MESRVQRSSAIIASLQDGYSFDAGPWTVYGIALGENDETVGVSGTATKWPPEALEDAAELLEGRKLTDARNHEDLEKMQPDTRSIVGEVVEARYRPGIGLTYRAEVDDPEIAKLIARNRVDVSPVIAFDASEPENDGDIRVAETIHGFRDLAVVPEGAASSNEISMKPVAEAAGSLPAATQNAVVAGLSASFTDTEPTDAFQNGVEIHTPTFSGTTASEWDAPNLEDFGEDPDLGEVGKHFLVARNGFPAENFGELALPVVQPDGDLSLPALRNAKARASQVSGLTGDALDRAQSVVNGLANENFDEAEFGEAARAAFNLKDMRKGKDRGKDINTPPRDTETRNKDMTEEGLTEDEETLLEEADSFQDPVLIEETRYDALQEKVGALESLMDTRLLKDKDLKEATVEAMSFDAKIKEFQGSDGELDTDALIQEPETGDPEDEPSAGLSDEAQGVVDSLGASDAEEAEALLEERMEKYRGAGWEAQAEHEEERLEALTGGNS